MGGREEGQGSSLHKLSEGMRRHHVNDGGSVPSGSAMREQDAGPEGMMTVEAAVEEEGVVRGEESDVDVFKILAAPG